MRRKSDEELKAANRLRQKRWREKHKWTAQQRKLACYGKSKAQIAMKAPQERERDKVSGVVKAVERIPSYGELRYEGEEGVDVGYEEKQAPRRVEERVPLKAEVVVEEEHKLEPALAAKLEAMKARQAARRELEEWAP